jgi:hypothetical protein
MCRDGFPSMSRNYTRLNLVSLFLIDSNLPKDVYIASRLLK